MADGNRKRPRPEDGEKVGEDFLRGAAADPDALRAADDTTEPAFLCDCMLGGLARWLRAAGYDALWQYHAEDGDLVRTARARNLVFATSDGNIMERKVIRTGQVRSVYVPGGLSAEDMLAFVAGRFDLRPREARCMACGGRLLKVKKEQVKDRAPPKSYARCDRFFLCARCGKLLWNGTHWTRIMKKLAGVFGSPDK